jgi:uncharacterized RDD family membrane protein YckC
VAYPPPPAAQPPGGHPLRDPTAVLGRRIAAWIVDALLYGALIFLFSPIGPAGTYAEIPDGMSGADACEIIQDAEDVSSCAYLGDRVYYVDDGIAFLGLVAAVGWFVLVLVIWQGLAGATPGKLLFGVRVVDEAGLPPGLGRAFGRSILWIVDAAPWIVPLVGPITALTSTGHRRVGDMAAKTFVVATADTGTPPQVPGFAPQVF